MDVMVSVRMIKCDNLVPFSHKERVLTLFVITVCIGHLVWFLTWDPQDNKM